MSPWSAAKPGDPVTAIDTPALVLDLDAFERNLQRMADALAGTGVRLRAHAKAHKCPEIAMRQNPTLLCSASARKRCSLSRSAFSACLRSVKSSANATPSCFDSGNSAAPRRIGIRPPSLRTYIFSNGGHTPRDFICAMA